MDNDTAIAYVKAVTDARWGANNDVTIDDMVVVANALPLDELKDIRDTLTPALMVRIIDMGLIDDMDDVSGVMYTVIHTAYIMSTYK